MKKAQDGNPLFSTILFAIIFFTLLGLVYTIIPILSGQGQNLMCSMSATTMAGTKFFGLESPIINDLKCETHYVKIKEDGIYAYNGKTYQKDNVNYRRFNDNPNHYMQKAVADELYRCWKYLGEGEIDPFGNYDDSSKCVVCSQIEFDSQVTYKKEKFEEFNIFLKNNYVKDSRGAQTTYWDFLSGGARNEDGQVYQIDLETQPQSIVFISVKPDKLKDLLLVGGLTGLGGTACSTALPALGWFVSLAGKIPGSAKLPSKILMVGSKISKAGGATFALACKESPLIKKGMQRGLLMFGSYKTFETANGDQVPRVLLVEMMPTSEVGKKCEKLYG
ncbi:hypothetical protein HYU11_01540 [Candidatus Woesearchaeota archaeon]|nr:hypothetical protein [Candidatus Woesearchaeota archaeon]